MTLDPAPLVLHSTLSQPYQREWEFAQDEYLMVWKEWRYPGNDDLLARQFNTSNEVSREARTNSLCSLQGSSTYESSLRLATVGIIL